MLGRDSTLPATIDFMLTITTTVRRAAPDVCLAADMPFLFYHTGTKDGSKTLADSFSDSVLSLSR